ncbi:unnamed protein product [Caenorhabditis sp. 36 PRJEB53466]|nr:unnamed protein product [Caenorhabditis sp. 36 PRJEB53466]
MLLTKLLLAACLTLPFAYSWTGATIRNHPADVIAARNKVTSRSVARAEPVTSYLRPCYFTNWAQYRQGRAKFVPEDYTPGLCTHILFAFGWMNADYTVRAYDPADLPNDWAGDGMYKRVNALKNTDTALKTLLSFGGWSFGTALFQGMSASAASRKVFIDSAITFVRTYGFDGIDIDWEYPSGATEMANFVALIKELRAACESESGSTGKDRLLVTAAVASGQATIDAGYDIANLAPNFDFILLMSYDFFGAWASLVGFNSPLYSTTELPTEWNTWNVEWAARHWNEKGMPKEKIVVGLPTYGRGWTLNNSSDISPGTSGSPAKITQYVQEAGVGAYFEFCEMLASGATRYWDSQAQVPYLVQGNQWWSYDDEESFSNKIAYIKREGFGGAFVWTLDFDDFNAQCSNSNGQLYPLISVIAKQLGGVTIPTKSGVNTATTTTTAATTVTTGRPAMTSAVTTTTTTTTTTTAKPATTTTIAATSSTVCSGKSNGQYADSTNCSKFVLCLNSVAYSIACPSGLQFSSSLRYCTTAATSGCVAATTASTTTNAPTTTTKSAPTVTTTTAKTTTSAPFKCTTDGFFGVASDCLKFIRCVNGISYNFECPNGLSFHADTMMCDRPDPSKCAK